MEEDTGAGSHVVILVARGTEAPGVRPAVTPAGGWLPAAPPGQAERAVVVVVADTGAGGEVEVLQPRHTAPLPLTATLTLHGSLQLHLPTDRLVLPRPPPGHRHHDLDQDHHSDTNTLPGINCLQ